MGEVIMEISIEMIALLGIFFGVLGRTYFPYLKKLGEYKAETMGTGKVSYTFNFDIKFILTAVFSGIVTTIFIFPIFVFPEDASLLNTFIASFIFAWGTNDVVNNIAH